MKKTHSKYFAILALVVLTSGCGLFRKKNRCNSCPKWSQVEQVEAPVTASKN